jgi:hypothetical protein
MKVRWQFFFTYEDLKFENSYTYSITVTAEQAEHFGLPRQGFEAEVTVGPYEKKHGSKQFGKIHITLPGTGEQTKDLAYSIAFTFAEHVTFTQARIELDGSFISNELLPETHEEETAVGENRFSWTLQIREVGEEVPFDHAALQRLTHSPLIKQFNEANNAKSPVDRFIGLFKILEDSYGGHPLKASFKNSPQLKQIALQELTIKENGTTKPFSQTDFENLVDDLVDTRHECAHLRSSTGFGITYGDARVDTDVEPLLLALEVLAFEAVQEKVRPTV